MMRKARRDEPVVAGVYVLHGPRGVYVGLSNDCYERHVAHTRLGAAWGIVRECPNASRKDMLAAEQQVADTWASHGWAVVSRNTSGHAAMRLRKQKARKLSAEHQRKLIAVNTGRKNTPETLARMSAARRGMKLSPEARLKISRALTGKRRPPEVIARISAALKGRKRSPEICAKISAGWARRRSA